MITSPEPTSDPAVIVETLELLQVFGLEGATEGDVDAAEVREVAEHGNGLLLRVASARRAGYLARKNMLAADACPFAKGQDVGCTRERAAWLSGWMLRQLAEYARPGEQMPTPDGVIDPEDERLHRIPFFREFQHFAKLATKRAIYARLWKGGARALRMLLGVDPTSRNYQTALRQRMSLALAEMFIAAGGVNRVEWGVRFHDPRLGHLAFVLERVDGKPAGVLIAEATARAEAAERELAEFRAGTP